MSIRSRTYGMGTYSLLYIVLFSPQLFYFFASLIRFSRHTYYI